MSRAPEHYLPDFLARSETETAAELVLRDSAALLLAQLQGWESLMNPESKHYDASFAPSLAAIRAAIACANGTSPAIRRPVRLFDSV